jgi:gamma-glutamylcyclotransferase (GGCT)/AIG2-like uncharacterized protein YtfP
VRTYFAYGSNMNPLRVRERGLAIVHAEAASLCGHRLEFDKHTALPGVSAHSEAAGHANVVYDPNSTVEGVLYWLASVEEIGKMDRFEVAPVNYGRDVVQVQTLAGPRACWTYFANPAVRRSGLRPPRSYLNHLLAGEPYLSAGYLAVLRAWNCIEDG